MTRLFLSLLLSLFSLFISPLSLLLSSFILFDHHNNQKGTHISHLPVFKLISQQDLEKIRSIEEEEHWFSVFECVL